MSNLYPAAKTAISRGKIGFISLDSGAASRQGVLCNSAINPYARTKASLPAGNLLLGDFSVRVAREMGGKEIFLATAPHGHTFLSRYFSDSTLHGIKINVCLERELSGPLGAINNLFYSGKINAAQISTLCVCCADIVHNLGKAELLSALDAHLQSGAALTAVVHSIPWESKEWESRSFSTFLVQGMPQRSDYDDFGKFQAAVAQFAQNAQKRSLRISKCFEKEQDETRLIMSAGSNLLSSGIFFIDMKIWSDLQPNISSDFNDFGFHLFPALSGDFEAFRNRLGALFLSGLENELYPFYAHVLPEKKSDGSQIYCRDITNPLALLGLNHDIAEGLVDTNIGDPGCAFWRKIEGAQNGYVGTSSVELNAKILSGGKEGMVGPIIGSHSNIRGEIGPLTVIGDYSIVKAASVKGSLIFGGTPHRKVYIGEGWRLQNCIVIGPVNLERSSIYGEFGRHPYLHDLIVYPDSVYPDAWRFIPISRTPQI